MLCPYCLHETREFSGNPPACPGCGEPVPRLYARDYPKYPPVHFSLIGLSGHGKTVFLSSLLYLFDRIGLQWPHFSYAPLDETGLASLQEKQRALEKGDLPESSRKSFPRPVILRLDGIPGHSNCHLLLYDTGGEVFERVVDLQSFGGYVATSPTIVWLLSLTDLQHPSQLLKLLTIYHQAVEEMGGDTARQTLLLVLTKGDLLLNWPDLPESVRNRLEGRPGDEDTGDDARWRLSGDVLAWLERTSAYTNFARRLAKTFGRVECVVLSALGSAPVGNQQVLNVNPRGVLDPLLWTLELAGLRSTSKRGLTASGSGVGLSRWREMPLQMEVVGQHSGLATFAAFSEDNRYLVYSGADGVQLWCLDGTNGRGWGLLGPLLAASPNLEYLVFTDSRGEKLHVQRARPVAGDAPDYESQFHLQPSGKIFRGARWTDGTALSIVSSRTESGWFGITKSGYHVESWDRRDGRRLWGTHFPGDGLGIAELTDDGRRLIVVHDNNLIGLDVSSGRELYRSRWPWGIDGFCLGRSYFVCFSGSGSEAPRLGVHSVASGERVTIIDLAPHQLRADCQPMLSPDESVLFLNSQASGRDGPVLFRWTEERVIGRLTASGLCGELSPGWRYLGLSPDGTLLALGTVKGGLGVWRLDFPVG